MSAARAISLAPLTAAELTPPELVTCAARAGYSHVGMRIFQGAPQADSPMAPGRPMLLETRRRLDAEGLQALDVEVVRLDGVTVVADCRAGLEAAAFLGGRHLVVIADDPEPARLAHDFLRLCELAGEHGLSVDIETIPYYRMDTMAKASRLIGDTGVANGGVLIDPLHFDRVGERVGDIAALPPAQLHFAQLCDAPAERPTERAELIRQAREERLFPGEGGIDLLAILRALPRDLPIAVEVPKLALSASVDALARARMALEATRAVLARL